MGRHVGRATVTVTVLVVIVVVAACSGRPVQQPDGPTGAGPTASDLVGDLPQWRRADGLRVPRDDFGTAVVGDDIWVLGGMTGDRGNRLDSVEVLDTAGDTGWRLADVRLPEPLAAFEAVAVGPRIYLFGGLDTGSRPSDLAAVLDTSTGLWQSLPPLPTARYAHTATLHRGLVYLIGGESADGPVARVDVYDPRRRTWGRATPMPQARASHDAVSVDDRIYVLGGWQDGGPSDVVQTYQPPTGRWSTAGGLPEPVSRAGVAYVDGLIWVSYHRVSFVHDPVENTWHEADPLGVSRHGLAMAAVGDRVYAIGGCSESPLRDVRTVDVLDVTDVSLE